MIRVRFAPSPTGSLHVGSALIAVANRSFADERGGVMLLRIDDTDAARSNTASEEGILEDLDWLGVRYDEGPVRQSERTDVYRAAAERLLTVGSAFEERGAIRFDGERRPTLVRADGRPTYHLATVVDDAELGISHVIRGKDHLANTPLHIALAEALGAAPPRYIHVGLVLAPDGHKLSKRHAASTLADLRAAGLPGEAVRAYLDELGIPRGDVHLDLPRLRRLAVDAIAAMPDAELAARAGAPLALVPALRGARDLNEARETVRLLLAPERVELPDAARATLERFRELRELANGTLDAEGARALVRELKAVGGDLRAVRLALTGRDRGPELWTVILALPRDEVLRRIDAAL
jgi:glutamyl/glutaminyl-tRNA synthetase